MKNYILKNIRIIKTVVLLCGTLFAWSKLLDQISIFQIEYGTLFRFHDCSIPNPFTTPCLYGSLAFLVAFAWSYYLVLKPNMQQEKYLRNFLIFCVVFAGSVVSYEIIEYYKIFDTGGIIKSCSPGIHPLKTPCFSGLLFFIAASSISFVTVSKNNTK